MKTIILLLMAVTILITPPAQAEMYKWVDENGTVTFKDTPPPRTKKRPKVKVYSDADFAPAPPPAPVQQSRGSRSPKSEERATDPGSGQA